MNWNPVAVPGITYSVYRSTSPNFTLDESTMIATGVTDSEYEDDSTESSTTYYYIVTSDDEDGDTSEGSGPDDDQGIETPEPPPGVTTGLRVTEVDGGSITFVWESTVGAQSYNIYRTAAGEAGSDTPYEEGVTATTFTDDSISSDGAYAYTIVAVNDGGEGPQSLSLSAASSGADPGVPDPIVSNSSNIHPNDVVVQPDGKMVFIERFTSGWGIVSLLRFNPDGTPDATFGMNGVATTPFTCEDYPQIELQEDGKFVLMGYDLDEDPDPWIARCNPDGSVDTSFGAGGLVRFQMTGETDFAEDVAIDPQGNIVAAGWSYSAETGEVNTVNGATFTHR